MAEDQQQELRDVLQAAQTALEEGRPQESIAACRHVLRHYPDSVTALRLLGEACLEAGRSDEAARAFEKAISGDPHNVLSRVGLGVIAEDRGEDERAIAQFRLAWEIEPTLPQLRGELVRLYRKRYGAGGRLRLTRVALANLHRRNDELLRAIGQLRQLYDEDPSRPEVVLAFAEALWRHDEDDEAAVLCQAILAERPRTARALLILASIQGDNGLDGEVSVDDLLAAARGFDPDFALAGELIGLRPSETLVAHVGDVPTVPAFDPATAPASGTDEFLSQGVAGQGAPMTRWEDIASGLTGETASIRSATNLGVVNDTPAAGNPDQVDELFAAIDRELAIANEHGTGALPEIAPFDLPEAEIAAEGDDSDWDADEDTMAPAPDEPSAVERLTANWDNIDNELAAARPTDDMPHGMTGMLSALGDLEDDLVPFDVDKASEEKEDVISFDPSKFSLPPLDDEDEDDLGLDLDTSDLEEEIAPFTLESAGVRTKPIGSSFADLVGKVDVPLPSNSAGKQEAAPDAEPEAVTAAASIFVTRELGSLSQDQLLELQASMPGTDLLTESPASQVDTAPIAEPEQVDLLIDSEANTDNLVLAETSADPEPVAAEGLDELVAEEEGRGTSSTADLDKLLSSDSQRLVAPPTENYPVDATRPLLADEALELGLAAAPDEDRLVSKLPVAAADDDEPGMDKLFNRLRHRKNESLQTGDLLGNRRAQSPGADTGEIAGPIAKTQRPELPLLPPVDDEEIPPAADTAAFLAALDTDEAADEPQPEIGDGDESFVDDTWLTSLVGDEAADEGNWGLTDREVGAQAAPPREVVEPVERGSSFTDLLGEDAVLSAHTPAPVVRAAEPASHWTGGDANDDMPDQPAPPSSDWSPSGGGEAMPHWGDEAIDTPLAATASATPINGHHHDAQDSVVMRVRTPAVAQAGGSRPPTAAANARPAARPVMRQTEQLAQLSAMVEADPENHFARLTLAVAYTSSHQPELALTEYRRLIKESEELLPEVIERLKEMIADGEAPARTHRILGDAYMKLGQFDLAMAEFQRALTARPRVAK